MILWIIGLMFIAGLGFGAGGMNWWNETALAHKEAKRVEAEARVEQATKEAIQVAENNLIDMQASFEAGQSEAKVVQKTVYIKGQTYVQNTPAYSNPQCVIDSNGVLLLNDQIATLRATAAAALGLGSVPNPGANTGNLNVYGVALPAVSGEPSPTTGVRENPPKSDRPGAVPGQGVPGRPEKPKPIN